MLQSHTEQRCGGGAEEVWKRCGGVLRRTGGDCSEKRKRQVLNILSTLLTHCKQDLPCSTTANRRGRLSYSFYNFNSFLERMVMNHFLTVLRPSFKFLWIFRVATHNVGPKLPTNYSNKWSFSESSHYIVRNLTQTSAALVIYRCICCLVLNLSILKGVGTQRIL